MYEGSTTEEFCPSFSLGTKPGGHGMPFLLVNNMLKNVKVVMQCSECSSKWRLCKAAIETNQCKELDSCLDDLTYTCGSSLSDIDSDEESVNRLVFEQENLTCESPIETHLEMNQFVIFVAVKTIYF